MKPMSDSSQSKIQLSALTHKREHKTAHAARLTTRTATFLAGYSVFGQGSKTLSSRVVQALRD